MKIEEELEVHIKGDSTSGKTALLRCLKDYLLDEGLQVTVDNDKHILYVRG